MTSNNNNSKSIKIIQLNVNSLRSMKKKEELNSLIRTHHPQIIMLCETKLNNTYKFQINKYDIYRNDREENNGGGTAICILNTIKSEYIECPEGLKSIECCIVKIKINNNQNLYISSVYKPPKYKIDTNDITKMVNIDNKAKHIIAGDFNAHHTAWNDTNVCENGRKIYEWYTEQTTEYKINIIAAKEATCYRAKNGSNIDFGFLVGNISSKGYASIDQFSDHAALIHVINAKTQTEKNITIKNYNKTNWKSLNRYLDKEITEINIPTNEILSKQNIDTYVNKIKSIYGTAIVKYVPEIKIKNKTIILSVKSMKLIKEKKTLLRQRFRQRHTVNYKKINSDIKLIEIMITNSLKNDYSKYIENRMKSIKMDNNVYKNIKQISNYKEKCELPKTLYEAEKKETKYDSETAIANALAEHFEKNHLLTHKQVSVMETHINSIYDKYNDNTPEIRFNDIIKADFKDNNNLEEIINNTDEIRYKRNLFISLKELKTIITERNTKKSQGYDKTSNFMLKKVSETFIKAIMIIFNHCINIKYFPTEWKFGVLTPLVKPGKNKLMVESYRPVAQLSAIGKLLEKKLDMVIRTHCEDGKRLNPFQFGFQPRKSTELAVCKFIADTKEGLNKKEPTVAILLDFQAAFDTIWHKALIYKMHRMGFAPNTIQMIKSYMADRKFSVKVGDKYSGEKEIKAGVPQGGVLSAILYLIYTNDFPIPDNDIKNIFFADDTIINITTNKIKRAQEILNRHMNKIANYTKKWKLKLNENKCEQISIIGQCTDTTTATRKQAKNIEIKINNKSIKKCTSVKYLGVMLANNMKFTKHVDHIIKKINSVKTNLAKIFTSKYIKSEIKTLCYKQLIRPMILYACACWMDISSHQMERIRKCERWF